MQTQSVCRWALVLTTALGGLVSGAVQFCDHFIDRTLPVTDTWFENLDGKGREWIPHQNIPMGRKGPYGICVRTAVVDMDGDGKQENLANNPKPTAK